MYAQVTTDPNNPEIGGTKAMVQEQLTKGTAILENTGVKYFGGMWKMLFFTCAACVVAAGAMSIIHLAWAFASPWDFTNNIYLTLFGLLMLMLDFPLENHPIAVSVKKQVTQYALFMTRFTGRGIWYLFLASMVFGALWDNNISPFLGFVLSGYMVVVAIICIVVGARLSQRLEAVRQKVIRGGPEQWGAYIPPSGMTKAQFRDLAQSLNQERFSDEELNYIVAGMSQEVKTDDIISKEEFTEWSEASTGLVL
jgi:hypothetical protein